MQQVDQEGTTEPGGTVLWLGDPRCCTRELVGSKASLLARLMALDYEVPDGFCVTTQVLTKGEKFYRRDVLKAAQRLGRPWIARSSATVEDSPGHLFPGLFATFLGLSDEEALLAAITRIAASRRDQSVVAYAKRLGVDPETIHMAVLVQTLVPAKAAGVAFSRHPVSGERQVLVEANHGLGETVVDGSVDPDRFSATSDTVVARILGSKQVKAVTGPSGVRRCAATEREQHTPAISDSQVVAVATLARKLENDLGYPVDLEWAIAAGRFYVLQARPSESGGGQLRTAE
jgi:rifampicin phosphotransferase